MSDNDNVIPEDKIREAHAKCMQDPALARYFDDAPPGARQYIALMFYCTVFQDEVDDEKCALYQSEVEEDLSKEDLLYLATHDRNPESKAHFRELYVELVSAEQAAEGDDSDFDGGAAPAATFDTRNLEQAISGVQKEVHQVRRLVAEQVTREDTAPGALTLGTLSLLLLIAATLTPDLSKTIVISLVFVASVLGLCASVRESREFKPARIGGAILAGLSLLGGLGMLFMIGLARG